MTVGALDAVNRSARVANVKLQVFLVDDGSTDETAAQVRHLFPNTRMIKGTGNLYWNGGMRLASMHARPTNPDYYLWLNDDLTMWPDVLANMLEEYMRMSARHGGRVIVVGRTVDPVTLTQTYGGLAKVPGFSPMKIRPMKSGERACITMNGNCVLIPRIAFEELGINSAAYSHGFGDIDYGFRASKGGYKIIQTIDPVGFQPYNQEYFVKNQTLTMSNWRSILFHPKGVPVLEWLAFCRVHGGYRWPILFLWRYIKMVVLGIIRQR